MSRLDRCCSVADCPTPVWAREMCRKHYMRWHQHGDPSVVLVKQSPAGEPAAFIAALPHLGEGCVLWPYSKNNMGYAQINTGDGKRLVSRRVCEAAHGPPPTPSHQAAHSCGNGHEGCIAPWHLGWKTPLENNHDMDVHGTRRRGEACKRAKLTEADVRQIRGLLGTKPQRQIGEDFGVTQTMISRIGRGVAWTHVQARAA